MKLIPIVATLLLTACSSMPLSFDMVQKRPYDPVEYDYAIKVATNVTHAIHRCSATDKTEYNTFVQSANLDSATLVEFLGNKRDTVQTLPAVRQIRDMVMQVTAPDRVNASVAYCFHKLSNIQASARIFARGISNSDRFDVCSGNVETRYALFLKSYNNKEITKPEFLELGNDLVKLKDLDKSTCTLGQRAEMEKSITVVETLLKFVL